MEQGQQPEALRLADYLAGVPSREIEVLAAAELRRQHARIAELETQHREELRAYEITVANREARIAELEAQLEAIGAGGVEPLRKPAAAQQAEPFMWAIQGPSGRAFIDEGCVSTLWESVRAEVNSLNSELDVDDEPFKVVPVYLAATQPAAQGMEADLTDAQIDEAFNQMPDGAAGFLKSWGYRQFARAVLAAQAANQGEQA